ncbi:hypothetical protein A33O_17909 [Nitratireductor aquibiodomus RA22]|uniref:YbaK/aminoacyl-tRNA synthetase-associated domain-containing protein n=1 Tax=Nitratireductor aquibiodomus RA22 TaxID=1189611 RepID=I5BTB0_9HYPH|nr:hypothetical protein A33O_17909 [Nitratireductor aquibiodomus RA22]
MSKSIKRVQAAAEAAGLAIEVKRMGESTRTAEEAASQCGCSVAQIVKSLIFQGEQSQKLYLFLVSGSRQLDTAKHRHWSAKPETRRPTAHSRRHRVRHWRRIAARTARRGRTLWRREPSGFRSCLGRGRRARCRFLCRAGCAFHGGRRAEGRYCGVTGTGSAP